VPFYDALVAAIGKSATARGVTSIDAWQHECARRSLIEKGSDKETGRERKARLADWARAKSEFIAAKWISIDGDAVADLKGRWA
jgi:hypothetical protein